MSRAYKFSDPEGLYFITFATVGWIDVFTRLEYKELLIESLKFCQREKGLELFSWCIMTNHVHMIARAKEGYLLQGIMRDLKKYTSKQLIKTIEEHPQESRKEWMLSIFKRAGEFNRNNKFYQFWQQDNHPIELFSPEVIDQKLDYIHNNPVVTGIVENPEEYLYSSARDYSGIKGKLEIEFID
jgi:putative transposase